MSATLARAREIAVTLTKAQRAMVLASEPGGRGQLDKACGADIIGIGAWSTARALERLGLGDVEQWPGYYPPGLYFNNSEGLAVRRALEQKGSNDV